MQHGEWVLTVTITTSHCCHKEEGGATGVTVVGLSAVMAALMDAAVRCDARSDVTFSPSDRALAALLPLVGSNGGRYQ